MIDLYCERVASGLWAEPLNALTNLLFLVAALACGANARRRDQADSLALAAVLFAIGLGSGLFHTFASAWAQWLDVVPILVFELAYLALYLRRLAGFSLLAVGGLLLIFLAALGVAGSQPQVLNGSLAYLPAALAVAILGVEYYRAEGRLVVLGAALLFGVSLTARTVDNALCEVWPWGTHFIWHAVNALMLYLLLYAYMTSSRRAG